LSTAAANIEDRAGRRLGADSVHEIGEIFAAASAMKVS